MPVRNRKLTNVRVDFGWDHGGLVRAFSGDASDPVAVGQLVRAWDDDGTERVARVVTEDSDTIRLEVLPAAEAAASSTRPQRADHPAPALRRRRAWEERRASRVK